MIAAPVAGRRGLFRLKRVFALCFALGLVPFPLDARCRSLVQEGAGYDAGHCFWQTIPYPFSDR